MKKRRVNKRRAILEKEIKKRELYPYGCKIAHSGTICKYRALFEREIRIPVRNHLANTEHLRYGNTGIAKIKRNRSRFFEVPMDW